MDKGIRGQCGYCEKFAAGHPGELDIIKWVLFDDKTLGIYEKELGQQEVSELVHSPEFDTINRMLRDGGI